MPQAAARMAAPLMVMTKGCEHGNYEGGVEGNSEHAAGGCADGGSVDGEESGCEHGNTEGGVHNMSTKAFSPPIDANFKALHCWEDNTVRSSPFSIEAMVAKLGLANAPINYLIS